MNDAVSDPATVPTGRRGQIVKLVLAVSAIIIQVVLLSYYLPMGLGWGGFGYVANLAQGVIVLVVAGLLIRKRPCWCCRYQCCHFFSCWRCKLSTRR